MFIKRVLCCIHFAGIITAALAFWTLQAQASGGGLHVDIYEGGAISKLVGRINASSTPTANMKVKLLIAGQTVYMTYEGAYAFSKHAGFEFRSFRVLEDRVLGEFFADDGLP